jgi:hypothetical protein
MTTGDFRVFAGTLSDEGGDSRRRSFQIAIIIEEGEC